MTTNTQTKASLITFVTALVGFILLTSFMIGPYLLAMVMGGILALLSWPAQRWLKKRGVKSQLSALMVTLGVILLVVVPITVFTTLAVKQGITIAETISKSQGFSIQGLIDSVMGWEPLASIIDPTRLEEQFQKLVQVIGQSVSGVILSFARNVPEGGLQIALACLTCYFMLIDGVRFLNWIYARIPLASDVRLRLTQVFRETAISVIWATMAAAATQALIMFFAFLVLRVPAAFLAGGLTFIFAFIPFAGSVPIWIAGTVYLFLKDQHLSMLLMLSFGIFTTSIDNFVRPWILKGRNEMHPLVSLVSIFGGIQMFGLFGVFLGPIIAAVLISLLQIWPVIGRRYGLEFDAIVEPSQEELTKLKQEGGLSLSSESETPTR